MYQVIITDCNGKKYGKIFDKKCPVRKAIMWTMDSYDIDKIIETRNIIGIEVIK